MIFLYALLGFLAVPLVVKNRVVNLIGEDLGRSAHIEAVEFNPFSFRLKVHDFEMSDIDGEKLVAFDELLVDFEISSLYRSVWTFREIVLAGPDLLVERFDNNEWRLNRLMDDLNGQQNSERQGNQNFWVEELNISDGSINFTDRSVTPAAEAGVRDLQVRLTRFSSSENHLAPIWVTGSLEQGGHFGFDGNLALFPGPSISGKATTENIPLTLSQPYLQQFAQILIEQGELDSSIDLSLQPGQELTASGTIRIPGLEMRDAIEGERLLAWEELEIDRFEFESGELEISILKFLKPFGRIVVLENQSTNLAQLIVGEQGTADSGGNQSTTPAGEANVIIGGVRVIEGSMGFSDLSLPLPFMTYITGLNGTVSTIATLSTEPADVKLEGQVGEYGLARIEGTINVLDPMAHAGVDLEFRNLLMSDLSPYTVQFAGRRIDEGKLDLRLNYSIESGELNGENEVVISDLVLGEKVDHPDAASLPLGLAVALLKDADGVIDIDFPIRGNLNDPEIKVGGIIRKALFGLLTQVASAPFRFLGKLIGVESEDLGEFRFLAGRSDLAPPEREKISQLEQALLQRPQLTLEIRGVSDPAIDIPALQYTQLRGVVIERLDLANSEEASSMTLLDTEVLTVLETLFLERIQDTTLESLKADHSTSVPDQPEVAPVLDKLAYAAGLRDRLLASEVVSEQELAGLANQRAESIKAAFLGSELLDPGRIEIARPSLEGTVDGDWVTLELTVTSK